MVEVAIPHYHDYMYVVVRHKPEGSPGGIKFRARDGRWVDDHKKAQWFAHYAAAEKRKVKVWQETGLMGYDVMIANRDFKLCPKRSKKG